MVEKKVEKPEKNKIPGRKYTNLGLLFWIVLPVAFGPAAVICGVKGYLDGDEKRGIIVIVLGVVFAVASTIVGAIFMGEAPA